MNIWGYDVIQELSNELSLEKCDVMCDASLEAYCDLYSQHWIVFDQRSYAFNPFL